MQWQLQAPGPGHAAGVQRAVNHKHFPPVPAALQHAALQHVYKPADKGARIWGLWSTATTARGPMSMLGPGVPGLVVM